MRDYETVKVEQEVPNEFLLVLHDGEPPYKDEDDERPSHLSRAKGAYYKTIERKMQLKKKRANVCSISTLLTMCRRFKSASSNTISMKINGKSSASRIQL